MAVMIPNQPLDFHGSPGEQAVWKALRQLDEHCYIFHSLRWIRAETRTRSGGEGEGDFVVFDPAHGLLVIEVKSGGIRYESGQWYQTNLGTKKEKPIQDPEVQANRTRWLLIDTIRDRLGSTFACPVYHAVWFPSVDFPKQGLPLAYHPPMVLDAASLLTPADAVRCAFRFGSGRPAAVSLSPKDARRIVQVIAPALHAAPSMRKTFEEREQAFVRLTQEQARVLDFLEEQDRAVIAGAAGTGKTMVGCELARRLAANRCDVLFLCYNSSLRHFLMANQGAPRLTFHTFDSLAVEHCPERAGDFEGAKSAFLELLSKVGGPTFEHVIIDEGQDFEDDWVSFLDAATKKTFYILYDRNQLLFRQRVPEWIERADCRLVLRRNCRTTTQIARFAYRCAAHPIPPTPDTVDGPKPALHACITRRDAARRAAELVMGLLEEQELAPHEVAILTMEPPSRSILGAIDRVAQYRVSEVPTKGAVTFSSVRRFKGLEARAVVLVDLTPGDIADPRVRTLIYVAASRAMQQLHIVLHDCNHDSIAQGARAIVGEGKANAHSLALRLGATWEKDEGDV